MGDVTIVINIGSDGNVSTTCTDAVSDQEVPRDEEYLAEDEDTEGGRRRRARRKKLPIGFVRFEDDGRK